MSTGEQSQATGERLRVLAAAVALAAAALIVWQLKGLLLLAFAAVLLAVLLRALADILCARLKIPAKLSVGLAAVVVVAVLAGSFWLFGREISAQVDQFIETVPQAWEQLQAHAEDVGWLGGFIDQIEQWASPAALMSQIGQVAGPLQWLVTNSFVFLFHLLLVPFAALYLALDSKRYFAGALQLVPKGSREAYGSALRKSGRALRLWLVGQLAIMVVVGVITTLGVWLLGLPAPLALGLFAGLAEFVPFVGPVLAAIPALLLAFTLGPEAVLWTLLLYIAIQQVESYVLTPLVHRRAVRLPPALTMLAVLAFGLLLGPMGLILATPLTVVAFVLVKVLYVRRTLGDETEVPGEKPDDAAEASG